MLSFWRSTDGNIALLFALCATFLLGVAGLAIDYSNWTNDKAQLSEAADAGALAGARMLVTDGMTAASSAKIRAEEFTKSNLGSLAALASVTATVDTANGEVTVSANIAGRRTLSALFMEDDPTIAVLSRARAKGNVPACLLALNATDSDSFQATGSVDLELANCGMQVDSNHANALDETGAANVSATSISVTGGYSGDGFTPTPSMNRTPLGDPFLDISIPTPGPCTSTNLTTSSSTTLNPGVYCGGISATGGAITMTAGTYFIVDGDFDTGGNTSLSGFGVTLVLVGTARLQMEGTGAVDLSPPSSGPLAGLSIIQDRAAPNAVSRITGTGDLSISGAVYLPQHTLRITGTGGGTSMNPEFVALIADKVDTVGAATLFISADGGDLTAELKRRLSDWVVYLAD